MMKDKDNNNNNIDKLNKAKKLWEQKKKEGKQLDVSELKDILNITASQAQHFLGMVIKAEEAEEQQKAPKSLSLIELFHDKLLFSKVQSLMERKESYDFIIDYLNSKGKTISKGSLSNLKSKIIEAEERGLPLEDVLDKRRKTSIKDVDESKVEGYTGKKQDEITFKVANAVAQAKVSSKIYTNQQALEALIQKGKASLDEMEVINPNILLKAIELNQKLFGSKMGGLTEEAFKQYQLIVQAEITAANITVMKYVPEDKQQEALESIQEEMQKQVDEVGATKSGKDFLKALQEAGIDI